MQTHYELAARMHLDAHHLIARVFQSFAKESLFFCDEVLLVSTILFILFEFLSYIVLNKSPACLTTHRKQDNIPLLLERTPTVLTILQPLVFTAIHRHRVHIRIRLQEHTQRLRLLAMGQQHGPTHIVITNSTILP